MKKLFVSLLLILTAWPARSQVNGKYVRWSTGYIFTGNFNAVAFKCFTHLANFQVTVKGTGDISTGSLAEPHASFVQTCHSKGIKAIVCIGGAGQSKNFSAAT